MPTHRYFRRDHDSPFPRIPPPAAAPLRHRAARRQDRATSRARPVERREPRVHRGPGHVLPGHGRRRGASELLLQGWRSGFRAGPRPDDRGIPNYDGNGMYLSTGNTLDNPHVGLLFIDFANRKRLRVNGSAALVAADSVDPPYAEAQFLVRVSVREVFPNCPRYIHRLATAERSEFVPRQGLATPVPGWKRMEWAVDVLPAGDPAGIGDPARS
ncbi:MAG: pyridoxamine 5'-phosphate oxidase family protein [Steroidobacteraceae bacterium]